MGQGYATSEAPCIGRVTALDAGLPVTVPGKQVDRRCGSGLQAVVDAAMVVGSGNGDFVIAGGVESMSHAPFYNDTIRWGVRGGGAAVPVAVVLLGAGHGALVRSGGVGSVPHAPFPPAPIGGGARGGTHDPPAPPGPGRATPGGNDPPGSTQAHTLGNRHDS